MVSRTEPLRAYQKQVNKTESKTKILTVSGNALFVKPCIKDKMKTPFTF